MNRLEWLLGGAVLSTLLCVDGLAEESPLPEGRNDSIREKIVEAEREIAQMKDELKELRSDVESGRAELDAAKKQTDECFALMDEIGKQRVNIEEARER